MTTSASRYVKDSDKIERGDKESCQVITEEAREVGREASFTALESSGCLLQLFIILSQAAVSVA